MEYETVRQIHEPVHITAELNVTIQVLSDYRNILHDTDVEIGQSKQAL